MKKPYRKLKLLFPKMRIVTEMVFTYPHSIPFSINHYALQCKYLILALTCNEKSCVGSRVGYFQCVLGHIFWCIVHSVQCARRRCATFFVQCVCVWSQNGHPSGGQPTRPAGDPHFIAMYMCFSSWLLECSRSTIYGRFIIIIILFFFREFGKSFQVIHTAFNSSHSPS